MATRRRHTGAAAARLTRVGLGLLQQWGAILSLLGLHLAAASRTAQRAQGQTARRHRCGRQRGPARLSSAQLGFTFPRRRSPPARLCPAGAGQRRSQPRGSCDRRGGRKRLQRHAAAGPPSAAIFSEGGRSLSASCCLTRPHQCAHRRAEGVAVRDVPNAEGKVPLSKDKSVQAGLPQAAAPQ